MNKVTFVFLILFSLPMAMASIYDGNGEGITELYSSTIDSGNSIELDNEIFILTATAAKASLVGAGVSLIAATDDCDQDESYGFCVDSNDLISGKRTVSVRIYKVFPFFSIIMFFDYNAIFNFIKGK